MVFCVPIFAGIACIFHMFFLEIEAARVVLSEVNLQFFQSERYLRMERARFFRAGLGEYRLLSYNQSFGYGRLSY